MSLALHTELCPVMANYVRLDGKVVTPRQKYVTLTEVYALGTLTAVKSTAFNPSSHNIKVVQVINNGCVKACPPDSF